MTVVIRKKFSASHFWEDCVKYNCTVRLSGQGPAGSEEQSLGICAMLGKAQLLKEGEAWTGSACPSQTTFQGGGAVSFPPGVVIPCVQALSMLQH